MSILSDLFGLKRLFGMNHDDAPLLAQGKHKELLTKLLDAEAGLLDSVKTYNRILARVYKRLEYAVDAANDEMVFEWARVELAQKEYNAALDAAQEFANDHDLDFDALESDLEQPDEITFSETYNLDEPETEVSEDFERLASML